MYRKELTPPVPETEEVREITENSQERDKKEAEANNELIRNNLSYYSVDQDGNFVHIDSNAEKSYIKKEEVDNYKRVITIMGNMIINETDDEEKKVWEIKEGNYHNKKDGRIMFSSAFDSKKNEQIKQALSEKVSGNKSINDWLLDRGNEGRRGKIYDKNEEWVSWVMPPSNK